MVSKWDSAPASDMEDPGLSRKGWGCSEGLSSRLSVVTVLSEILTACPADSDSDDPNPRSPDQGQAAALGAHPVRTYQLCWPPPGALTNTVY